MDVRRRKILFKTGAKLESHSHQKTAAVATRLTEIN
jgi:hypothetical protein